MTAPLVLYEKQGRIARVTLNRPEGFAFKKRCEEVCFKRAVRERDSGAPISGF